MPYTNERVLRFLPIALVLIGCGRTDLVRYSGEGDELDIKPRMADGGIACTNGEITLKPARPVVMLAVDRSTSMNSSFPNTGLSKWNALRGALHEALPAWNDSLELGLQLFPNGSNSSCSVASTAELTPAYQSVSAILALLDARSPGGATPTAIGVERAGAALMSLRTASSAKAVILATDGAPDCNTALNPATCTCVGGNSNCSATRCLDDTRTIDRIATLANSGIPTWIIGLRSNSDATFVSVLNRMAIAGGRPMTGTNQFFTASSQAELETAFADIRKQVGRCAYLTTSVPDLGGSIELYLEGDFTPYDPHGLEGWQWVDADNGELKVFGAACDRAEALPLDALSVVVRCSSP